MGIFKWSLGGAVVKCSPFTAENAASTTVDDFWLSRINCYLYISLCPFRLPACLSVSLSVSLPACLPALSVVSVHLTVSCLPVCLSASQPTANLPACHPSTCLFLCLFLCVLFCLSSGNNRTNGNWQISVCLPRSDLKSELGGNQFVCLNNQQRLSIIDDYRIHIYYHIQSEAIFLFPVPQNK